MAVLAIALIALIVALAFRHRALRLPGLAVAVCLLVELVLGVVIGVMAVITMVTVGNGASQAIRTQIESFGNNQLMLRPGLRMGPGQSVARRTSRSRTPMRSSARSRASSPWRLRPPRP